MKKNCKKQMKKEFGDQEAKNRKGDKFYVKWKGSFSSWIDKKRHCINEWIFYKTKIFRRKSKS